MSSEHSSKPLPELKGAVARKSPEILKIENSEHLVTSPISGPDNSLSSPAPSAQSKYIEMASTPPTMQRSNGLSDTVNDPESHTDTDDHVDSAEQHSASQDPAEKIKDFDWSALEKKHHEAMAQCLQSEQSLNEEFDQLVKVPYFLTFFACPLTDRSVLPNMGRHYHAL